MTDEIDDDFEEEIQERVERLETLLRYYNPLTRDGKINIFKDSFARWVEDEDWIQTYNPSEEAIDDARENLAKEYFDLAIPICYSSFFLLVLLVATDYFVSISAQVYGISLSLWAAPASVFPSLRGAGVIATVVDDENIEAQRKLAAQEMAIANVVLLVLITGFLLQLVAVEFLKGDEFLTKNVASNFLPDLASGIFLILVFVLTMLFFARLRK